MVSNKHGRVVDARGFAGAGGLGGQLADVRGSLLGEPSDGAREVGVGRAFVEDVLFVRTLEEGVLVELDTAIRGALGGDLFGHARVPPEGSGVGAAVGRVGVGALLRPEQDTGQDKTKQGEMK